MGVSTVDGTIEGAEPGRRAAGVRFFKKIVFRLNDGGTKTVAKAVVHSDLAEHLQPGTRGRFYLFTAIDHRGLHGLRLEDGRSFLRFPRNNERLTLIMVFVMALWIAVVVATRDGIPLFPTFFLLAGIPSYFLFRNTRIQAERQFEADNAGRASTAAAPAA